MTLATDFIRRPVELARQPHVQRRAVQAAGGLTVGAVVWIYATFATQRYVEHFEDKTRTAQAEQWRHLMDLETQVARLDERTRKP